MSCVPYKSERIYGTQLRIALKCHSKTQEWSRWQMFESNIWQTWMCVLLPPYALWEVSETDHKRSLWVSNNTFKRALCDRNWYWSEGYAEFICQKCHGNLHRKKKNKMLLQAVASGLSLPHCTYIRNGMLAVQVTHTIHGDYHTSYAWEHYRINRPCVNVPTTLKHVCNILQCIQDEAQIVPIK